MPFAKGKSGNPGGRPKELASIQKLARESGELAIRALVHVATNGVSESARVSAATALLDRGFGKPVQETALTVANKSSATDWTRDELVAFLNDAKARGDGESDSAPADPEVVH